MIKLLYKLAPLIVLSIFGGIILYSLNEKPEPQTMIATPYHTPVNSECENGGCNLK